MIFNFTKVLNFGKVWIQNVSYIIGVLSLMMLFLFNVSSNIVNVSSNISNVSSNIGNVSSNIGNVSSNIGNVSSNSDYTLQFQIQESLFAILKVYIFIK